MTTLILLAAGRGSRLGNLTSLKPKCLMEYQGRVLIENIISQAEALGTKINGVHIVSGYRHEQLEYLNLPLLFNESWETSGPFASLLCADEILKSDNSVISYTDIFYDLSFLEAALQSTADIFIPNNTDYLRCWSHRKIDLFEDLETFRFRDNLLLEIGSKTNRVDEIQGQFAGIMKTTPNGWKKLKEMALDAKNPKLDITSVLSLAIQNDVKVFTSEVNGFWKEFDLQSDFE